MLIGQIQLAFANTTSNTDASVSGTGSSVFARVDGREAISPQRQRQLLLKLRQITGLSDLQFQQDGSLVLHSTSSSSGSQSARALLQKAVQGSNLIIIEDTSRRPEVVFAQVIPGRELRPGVHAYRIQIDFVDFESLIGDQAALRAFDVGWAFLHELDHVIENSEDSRSLDEVGDCEAHINRMREECDLPLRADYFHTLLEGSAKLEFISRFVRLSFVQKTANKQKRYWVMWDAGVVGGFEDHRPTLSLTNPAESR
jgi:hypothetical protein